MSQEVSMLAERYALESAVADGGMATVWRARDEVLARIVAVKVLHPHLADDESFLERFRREALAAARLTHPNIVAIFDTGVDDGHHYIVMEYCPNDTLAELVRREGPLDADRAVAIGATICNALSYAHSSGVVHRDMKPDNVLIAADGTLKVADFGIAKAAFVGHEITTTGSLLGTVTYISPEQAQGAEPDHRSDIYSLGAMMYEFLTGRAPFKGETALATAMMHLKEQPAPLRSLRAGIPRSIEAAVLKALAKEPKNRHPSAEEFRRDLTRGATVAGPTSVMRAAPAPSATPASAPSHDDGRWIGRVIALVVALILVAVAIAWLLGPADDSGTGGDSTGATTPIDISEVADFDPHGNDGEEHSEQVGAAMDGDASSAWTTENYNTPLKDQKPGVGLVFDLGEEAEVGEIQVIGAPGMTFELRSSNEFGDTETEFERIETEQAVDGVTTIEVDAETAQYWLVWITHLPGDEPGAAAINEVRFFGP
ncbi:MAG: protein kinase domain-containing protein [Actinomycetota bacterium]